MTAETEEKPGTPGAEKSRRHRAKRAAVRASAADLVAGVREAMQAEARQQLLPLAPVAEQEDLAPAGSSPAGGRPPGAVARAAADWRAFMLARYRSPLVVLAEAWSRPTQQLAAELGCTPLEAFQEQMKAAREGAAYLHSKAPVAVQVDGAAVAPVVVAVTPGIAARLGMPSAPVIEVVEDQASSFAEGGEV